MVLNGFINKVRYMLIKNSFILHLKVENNLWNYYLNLEKCFYPYMDILSIYETLMLVEN